MDPDESAKDMTSSPNQYATLTPADYSEVTHLPPISFSIMAGFPLNKTWSIETGLMYTYMVSHFSKPGNVEYSGKLKLHYLGIPVRLKANVYQVIDGASTCREGVVQRKGCPHNIASKFATRMVP